MIYSNVCVPCVPLQKWYLDDAGDGIHHANAVCNALPFAPSPSPNVYGWYKPSPNSIGLSWFIINLYYLVTVYTSHKGCLWQGKPTLDMEKAITGIGRSFSLETHVSALTSTKEHPRTKSLTLQWSVLYLALSDYHISLWHTNKSWCSCFISHYNNIPIYVTVVESLVAPRNRAVQRIQRSAAL